ncbi:MAG: glycosyltransferase [Gaiellales bacterium]
MAASPTGLSILVAARDEEARIGPLVERLRCRFPGARVIVGDDGSRDGTAAAARAAGATVATGPRLGKGEALNAAERAAGPGPVLLCDADLEGELGPLVAAGHDLSIAAFTASVGGGLGIAKRAARELIRLRTGRTFAEPLSGQRFLSERARAACFPVARGFGCEVRMTIDACRAGLGVAELPLSLRHRPTGRELAGFAHRGLQLWEAVLASGPLAVNHRGNRLPLLGVAVALGGSGAPARGRAAVAAVVLVGVLDDLFSGPERGWRAHLRAGRTTGVLKLVAIPAVGLVATRSLSGALVVGLAANALNQLDTRPGRALKAFLLCSATQKAADGYTALAVLLLPYDLRERMMLGDAGANALGAVVGLRSVARQTSCGRWTAVGILAGLNVLGERCSLGALIERTPGLRELDGLGRQPA